MINFFLIVIISLLFIGCRHFLIRAKKIPYQAISKQKKEIRIKQETEIHYPKLKYFRSLFGYKGDGWEFKIKAKKLPELEYYTTFETGNGIIIIPRQWYTLPMNHFKITVKGDGSGTISFIRKGFHRSYRTPIIYHIEEGLVSTEKTFVLAISPQLLAEHQIDSVLFEKVVMRNEDNFNKPYAASPHDVTCKIRIRTEAENTEAENNAWFDDRHAIGLLLLLKNGVTITSKFLTPSSVYNDIDRLSFLIFFPAEYDNEPELAKFTERNGMYYIEDVASLQGLYYRLLKFAAENYYADFFIEVLSKIPMQKYQIERIADCIVIHQSHIKDNDRLKKEYYTIVKALLDAGLSLDYTLNNPHNSSDKRKLLESAIGAESFEIIKLLAERGATMKGIDRNCCGSYGYSSAEMKQYLKDLFENEKR